MIVLSRWGALWGERWRRWLEACEETEGCSKAWPSILPEKIQKTTQDHGTGRNHIWRDQVSGIFETKPSDEQWSLLQATEEGSIEDCETKEFDYFAWPVKYPFFKKDFLKTERMKSIKLPGKSYDLNPIENCFGLLKRKLEKEPTKSLEKASWALSAVLSLWIQNHKSIES